MADGESRSSMKVRTKPRKGASIIGIDSSLRAAAVCALPLDWNYQLKYAKTKVFGYELSKDATEKDHLVRLSDISDGILKFARDVQADHVWIENYAFSAKRSRAHALGEAGGTIKLKLFEDWGVVTHSVVNQTARKHLLQKLVRADVKKYVCQNVKRLGFPASKWTDDEIDAFVVANYGLHKVTGRSMSFEGEGKKDQTELILADLFSEIADDE